MMRNVPRLRDFEHVVFFTGAGLSAESGIPTYRGKGGMWAEYDYEDYACQRAFDRDPDRVWDFHDMRRGAVAKCEPNEGHRIIAKAQAERSAKIITQNIDGLHFRAGATDVVELHGSLWRVRCDREGTIREDRSVPMSPRRCACGEAFRPDIVWFEDSLDAENLRRAAKLLEGCDLLVSVGTSGVVYPAARLPAIAAEAGAVTVEINLEDTPATPLYKHRLRGGASEILSEMAR
jgi:NAD-dependent protein deacetylase/lipoamidase